MLVNLSLEQSARLRVKTRAAGQVERPVSAMDGGLSALQPDQTGFWLPAGQGVLLRIGETPP